MEQTTLDPILSSMAPDHLALHEAIHYAQQRLLSLRTSTGHWEGELSSSALSTATALFALSLQDPDQHRPLIQAGLQWLIDHQNEDGGWGDTIRSASNMSTTALCWAALSVGGQDADPAVGQAEVWLSRVAGSLQPHDLARAIARPYGKDRTFSVPILTMCALAGRLGAGKAGWRHVARLPFELAVCPPDWFRWLRLPVVSYALPALISLGVAGHHHRPSPHIGARLVRWRARARSLDVLRAIQPTSGGYLEATPLTSFVVMSLVASGHGSHPVVEHGAQFLARSVREDGSWPIDTNLETWLTTLSINAMEAGGIEAGGAGILPSEADLWSVVQWLLDQQYREVHPATRAQPGGWAWTALPGGVPDADDTAGALIALHHLGHKDERVRQAALAGVCWLLDLQNRDGGAPTFCRGWGALPFDRSGADLTAHMMLAWSAWLEDLPVELKPRLERGLMAGAEYLARTQRKDGAWVPLWFGNEAVVDDQNPTYGTARVLPALYSRASSAWPSAPFMRQRGLEWLLSAQNGDGGWGGDRGIPSSIEETALAVNALAVAAEKEAVGQPSPGKAVSHRSHEEALFRGVAWLIERTEGGRVFEPSPIGFYFARLWYFERDYPVIFTIGALNRVRRLYGEKPGAAMRAS